MTAANIARSPSSGSTPRKLKTCSRRSIAARPRVSDFRDDAGAVIPEIVLNSLDDDDSLALDEAARDFIPKRFRPKNDEAAAA